MAEFPLLLIPLQSCVWRIEMMVFLAKLWMRELIQQRLKRSLQKKLSDDGLRKQLWPSETKT